MWNGSFSHSSSFYLSVSFSGFVSVRYTWFVLNMCFRRILVTHSRVIVSVL
jgi:hypothetical protein